MKVSFSIKFLLNIKLIAVLEYSYLCATKILLMG